MKDRWEYYDGDFTADRYNDTLLRYSPWSGHRRFGYDLVSYYEPENLVELGSFYGCSTFAFMQAVKDNRLHCTIYPVDLWEAGDQFTVHDYEQDVYGFFSTVCEKEFSDISVEIKKKNFDDALREFEDDSIDILHIDGSHAYEDVKHDFTVWIRKVKHNGIVLFHDISEQPLYGKTLGSCIFWKELKEKYPYTVQMPHSWGLGLLFLDETKYRDFMDQVDLDHYLQLSLYDETAAKDRIRTDYFRLLDADQWIESLRQDKETADQDNIRLLEELDTVKKRYEATDRKKDAYAAELEETIREYGRTVEAKDAYAAELEETIRKYGRTVEAKDAYVAELRNTVEEYRQTVEAKDVYAAELEGTIREYGRTVEGKDAYAAELEEAIQKYGRTVEAKDTYAAELEETIREYGQTVEAKDAYAAELEETIREYKQAVAGKDHYIEELRNTIRAYQQENETIKNAYEQEIAVVKAAYEQTIEGKDAYIEELETAGKTEDKDWVNEQSSTEQ